MLPPNAVVVEVGRVCAVWGAPRPSLHLPVWLRLWCDSGVGSRRGWGACVVIPRLAPWLSGQGCLGMRCMCMCIYARGDRNVV